MKSKLVSLIVAILVFAVFLIGDFAYLSYATNNIKKKYETISEEVKDDNDNTEKEDNTDEVSTDESTTEEKTTDQVGDDDPTEGPEIEDTTTTSSTSEVEELVSVNPETTEQEPTVPVVTGTSSTKTSSSITKTTPTTKKTTTKAGGGTTKKTTTKKTTTKKTTTKKSSSSSSRKTVSTSHSIVPTTTETTMKPAGYNSYYSNALTSWEWSMFNAINNKRQENGLQPVVMADELRLKAEDAANMYLTKSNDEVKAFLKGYAFRAFKENGVNQTNGYEYFNRRLLEDSTCKLLTSSLYRYVGIGILHARVSSGETLDSVVVIYK